MYCLLEFDLRFIIFASLKCYFHTSDVHDLTLVAVVVVICFSISRLILRTGRRTTDSRVYFRNSVALVDYQRLISRYMYGYFAVRFVPLTTIHSYGPNQHFALLYESCQGRSTASCSLQGLVIKGARESRDWIVVLPRFVVLFRDRTLGSSRSFVGGRAFTYGGLGT